jgi:hypothetical protein
VIGDSLTQIKTLLRLSPIKQIFIAHFPAKINDAIGKDGGELNFPIM